MNLEDIYKPVAKELEMVERSLLEISHSQSEAVSKTAAGVLDAGGKRLRPALLLIAAKACNCFEERSIKLAVALELIHTASLAHDDVIDEAILRRGLPTTNSRWGNKVSVLLGDYFYSTVVGILAEDGDLEVIQSVASATSRMVAGELTQTLSCKDISVTEDKYLSMIASKTASLISCSCRVGAMLGETHNGEVDMLTDYGLSLGMAFQITDDLLDLIGDEKKLGKILGNDIREGRLTLPLIHAMSVADRKDRKWMEDVFKSGQIDGVFNRLQNMVRQHEGIEYSIHKAKEYSKACKKKLKVLEKSESRTSLALLADYVVGRVS